MREYTCRKKIIEGYKGVGGGGKRVRERPALDTMSPFIKHTGQRDGGWKGGKEGTYQFVSSSMKCNKRGVTV